MLEMYWAEACTVMLLQEDKYGKKGRAKTFLKQSRLLKGSQKHIIRSFPLKTAQQCTTEIVSL